MNAPQEYTCRYLLGEIAKIESQRETIMARLSEMSDLKSAPFSLGVTRLGNLSFELNELRRLLKEYQRRNKPDRI